MIGGGEERKECDTFKADHKNSDPEKPNTSLFPEDGVVMIFLILQKNPDPNVMMVMIVIIMMTVILMMMVFMVLIVVIMLLMMMIWSCYPRYDDEQPRR